MTEYELDTSSKRNDFWRQFPWWIVAAPLLGASLYIIFKSPDLTEAFQFIVDGLPLTLTITFASLIPALLIGILVGSASNSKYALLRNPAFFYLAIVGGIPTIVLILSVAFLVIPRFMSWFGTDQTAVSGTIRGIIGLSLAYSAIFGEAFRLSFSRGSDNRVTGHSRRTVAKIVIPAAFTFIALFKDSSLLSMLAVQEITQLSRLYAGSTFNFDEAYLSLAFLYLLFTIPLRFGLQLYEQWVAKKDAEPQVTY